MNLGSFTLFTCAIEIFFYVVYFLDCLCFFISGVRGVCLVRFIRLLFVTYSPHGIYFNVLIVKQLAQ
jgi:hypothetical protein